MKDILSSLLLLFITFQQLSGQFKVKHLESPTNAGLRGLHAVSDEICWASGAEGTVLRTTDGGLSWNIVSPKGYDSLQFRDIHAFDEYSAMVLSAGLPAVILRTTNGGKNWRKVYENLEEGVFFDAFDFWDKNSGIAFSDAVNDKLLIIKTVDGGESWVPLPPATLPVVSEGQGGFAASGTCLKTFGHNKVIIGLGGKSATYFLSENRGQTWMRGTVPLDYSSPSKGIFSFDFVNDEVGICVGGDYLGDSLTLNSVATTVDGGKSWQLVENPYISGNYRSCVCFKNKEDIIAVSRTGMSFSTDGGTSWKKTEGSFYTCSTEGRTIWLSGPDGNLAQVRHLDTIHPGR